MTDERIKALWDISFDTIALTLQFSESANSFILRTILNFLHQRGPVGGR